MSDGNTLIGNALVGHGLEQGGEAPTQGDTYLATEEAVIAQAEEHMMSQADTSEDDEKMEQQMLAVALVTSVVETSKQSPDPDKNPPSSSDQEAKQRYSLRKRRRPSGEQATAQPGANPPPVKVEPSASASSEPPPSNALSKKPQPPQSVKQEVAPKAEPATRIQIKTPSPLPPPPSQPVIQQAKVKTEAVPACTVAVAAAPLSIPLAASSLPKPSSLPPALQPPPRNSLPPMPPPKAAAPASRTAAKPKSARDKSKRLVPAARVPATSQPLTPNPAAIGVPNPLSNPLPASSKSILVTKPKNPPPTAPAAFKAGTKLTVPCPLPPSTFQSGASQATAPPAAVLAAPAADTEAAVAAPVLEKKKVTIDLPPQQRGRIFSIDLDPASLDFSVLDSGESGTPAPASADLPLVTGGARDRAFSFECFAFGINADEPLPPLAEQAVAEHDGSLAQQQDFVTLPRPRGDSIIFDPSSFQEGGIHEEHALTTRKTRGMSVDLEAAGLLPPSTESTAAVTSDAQGQTYLSEHPHHHAGALPQTAPSAPVAHPGSLPPPPPGQPLPGHPDTAPSSVQPPAVANPAAAPPPHAHVGHPHPPPPPPHHHHHHGTHAHPAAPAPTTHAYHHPGQPATGVPHPVVSAQEAPQAGGAVSIISSCASSTTLQMELLNKDGRIGIYLPEARKERIARFHAKRKMRIWRKRIKYDCRKKLADSRPRIKGRFVKRSGTD